MTTIKAGELKVGDSVKHNSRFRTISEVVFGEWSSVAKDSLGEKIPMVFLKFSGFSNQSDKGAYCIDTMVKVK